MEEYLPGDHEPRYYLQGFGPYDGGELPLPEPRVVRMPRIKRMFEEYVLGLSIVDEVLEERAGGMWSSNE